MVLPPRWHPQTTWLSTARPPSGAAVALLFLDRLEHLTGDLASLEGSLSKTTVLATFSDSNPLANYVLKPSGGCSVYSGQVYWGDGSTTNFPATATATNGPITVIQAPGRPGTFKVIGSHLIPKRR